MSQSLPPLGADFELWGFWWIPGAEAEPVAGQLMSRHGEPQLKLLGHFSSVDPNALWTRVPVIHGTAEAKDFTLWDAHQAPFSLRVPGTIEQTFEGMTVLIGNHLPPAHETRFSALTIYAKNLGPWSGIRPVEHAIETSTQGVSNVSFTLASDRSRDIPVTSHRLRLSFGSSVTTRHDEFSSYGFDCVPAVRVIFDISHTVDEVRHQANSLRRLFSLLVGVALTFERMVLEIEGNNPTNRSAELRLNYPPPDDSRQLHVTEILSPLSMFSDRSAELFDRWLTEEDRIQDATDLLISTIGRTSLPPHLQLIVLAQALEAFHRNVHSGGYMTPEEYEPVRQQLEAAIPANFSEGHRNALRSRIRFGYEFSLRKRLEELLRRLEQSTLDALAIDRREFPQRVAEARNDFTHWDASTGSPLLTGADLMNLVGRLKALTRIVLLNHLGIDEIRLVQRIVENRPRYLPIWISPGQ